MGPHPGSFEPMPEIIDIHPAIEDDMAAVQPIYAREVNEGVISFEIEVPGVKEMRRRFLALQDGGFPYLAATLEGRFAGYAYAAPYRPRPAYRFTVEDSVYVADWARRRGVASKLLAALVAACEQRRFRQMIAIIGDSANLASVELHRKAGFRMVGTLENVGYKFERWIDTVIMQRVLGAGAVTAPDSGPGP